jgi:hypothetical protein
MIDTSPAASPDDQLLTTADLAKRWNLSEQTLANQRSTGRGPRFLRVGGRVFYRWPVILAYEANGEREPRKLAVAA